MTKYKIYCGEPKTLHEGINYIFFKSDARITGGFYVMDADFSINYQCTPVNIYLDKGAVFVNVEPPKDDTSRLRPSKVVPYGTFMGYIYDN